MDRDHQVARVEKGRAVFVHEFHQRKQDGAACFAEIRMYGQCRDFGNFPTALPDVLEVKNRLQRKSKNTFANQRECSHHFAVELGA